MQDSSCSSKSNNGAVRADCFPECLLPKQLKLNYTFFGHYGNSGESKITNEGNFVMLYEVEKERNLSVFHFIPTKVGCGTASTPYEFAVSFRMQFHSTLISLHCSIWAFSSGRISTGPIGKQKERLNDDVNFLHCNNGNGGS